MTFSASNSASFHLFTDQNDISETQFLKDAIVGHTKYGSTNHNLGPSQNYRYITHYIDASDTLQGIALKYGVKIETLKKFNKLFSDDNNYLRSRYSLLIPIEISIEKNPNFDSDLSSTQTSSSSLNGKDTPWASAKVNDIAKMPTSSHSMTFEQKNKTSSKYPKSPNKSISLCDSSHLDTNSDNNLAAQESVADFLIRIDSSIAKTRNQVEKMSKKIDEGSIEEELNRATTTKRFNTPKLATSEHSVLSSTSSSRSSLFPFDGDGNLRLSANNNSRSKKVKSSLKRFEKSQEEIFEL